MRLEAAAALPAVLRPNLKHRDRCRWERADAHGLQQRRCPDSHAEKSDRSAGGAGPGAAGGRCRQRCWADSEGPAQARSGLLLGRSLLVGP